MFYIIIRGVCACVRTHMHVEEVRSQLVGVGSLLNSGSSGVNLGSQAWQQTLLPA